MISLIKLIIILFALFGLWYFSKAQYQIKREQKSIELLPDGSPADPNNTLLQTLLSDEKGRQFARRIDSQLNTDGIMRGHLFDRLQALIASVIKGNNTSRDAVKDLPRIHDLHELTLQRELSKTAPSGLKIIVSILLITGICGTLVGIHDNITKLDPNSLKDEKTQTEGGKSSRIDVLQPALEPSLIAIFSTVILIILRGRYIRQVDSFLADLDFLTVTQIIPKLQPDNPLDSILDGLGAQLNELKESMGVFNESSQGLRTATDAFSKSAKYMETCNQKIDSVILQIQPTVKTVQDHASSQGENVSLMRKQIEQLIHSWKTIESNNRQLREQFNANFNQYKNLQDQVLNEFKQTGASLQSIAQNLAQIYGLVDVLPNYSQLLANIQDQQNKFMENNTQQNSLLQDLHKTIDNRIAYHVQLLQNEMTSTCHSIKQDIKDLSNHMDFYQKNTETEHTKIVQQPDMPEDTIPPYPYPLPSQDTPNQENNSFELTNISESPFPNPNTKQQHNPID